MCGICVCLCLFVFGADRVMQQTRLCVLKCEQTRSNFTVFGVQDSPNADVFPSGEANANVCVAIKSKGRNPLVVS